MLMCDHFTLEHVFECLMSAARRYTEPTFVAITILANQHLIMVLYVLWACLVASQDTYQLEGTSVQ